MRICLSMIVKNEVHVIERALVSVKPIITHWIVVDTGSTDGTQDLVRRSLAGIPGEVVERPWRDFAANRSEALELARPHGDYALVIDADDQLELAAGFTLPPLAHGAYSLRIEYDAFVYYRLQLLRCDLGWRYAGVVHETPVTDAPHDTAILDGITYRIGRGGARARDPERFVRDAELLEAALARDPDNGRDVFYLGQSYRDAGMHREALAAYERRAAMGGWAEQTFYAAFQAAAMREALHEPRPAVWSAYLAAHQLRPTRAEPLVELARYCRLGGDFALAYLAARSAAEIPQPRDFLFVDADAYRWRALDELAVAAFYTHHLEVAAAANAKLLTEGRLPAREVERVTKNFQLIATRPATAR